MIDYNGKCKVLVLRCDLCDLTCDMFSGSFEDSIKLAKDKTYEDVQYCNNRGWDIVDDNVCACMYCKNELGYKEKLESYRLLEKL